MLRGFSERCGQSVHGLQKNYGDAHSYYKENISSKNKYLSDFLINLLFFNKLALYLHIEKK